MAQVFTGQCTVIDLRAQNIHYHHKTEPGVVVVTTSTSYLERIVSEHRS
jgi:hypothetical protein